MGGHALEAKGVFTRRYEDEEYKTICKEVKTKMEKLFPNNETYIIQAYRNKKSHGDMDILISCKIKDDFHEMIKLVEKEFKPNATNLNDSVLSFDYKDFQIDFIKTNEDYFTFQSNCMKYDPSFNLMGKCYYNMMCSYKYKGLYFVYRNKNGRIKKDILLTRDMRKVFEFGGFDYDRYLKGFDDLEEIFEFIIDGKYFNFDYFKLENLSQKNRKRNNKRSTFNAFIKYCNDRRNDVNYDLKEDRSVLYNGKNFIQKFEDKKDRDFCIDKVEKAFPNVKLREQLNNLDAKFALVEQAQEKFNGNIVKEVLNINGKELGSFIKYFKQELGIINCSVSLTKEINKHTKEEIKEMIKEKYKTFELN